MLRSNKKNYKFEFSLKFKIQIKMQYKDLLFFVIYNGFVIHQPYTLNSQI